MKLYVDLKEKSYPILIEKGAISNIASIINVNRKIAIIHDDNIPSKWIQIIQSQCPNAIDISFPEGENSKCMAQFEYLLNQCIQANLTRKDAIIAIGGGVTGDLAGFVAASYMRGIDFYNIPTTILSQVDSSVGGKVAIDMGSYKNIVGAFYQPKGVLIDPEVLSTLPIRQQHNGLVEALKMGLILDENLVKEFEADTLNLEAIITRSIDLKRMVVEQDEKENNLRKILNFGHTIGHAIEGAYGLDTYYHGECVAMGMLFFIEDNALKQRILNIYKKLDLPTVPNYDVDTLMEYITHDKKGSKASVSIIKVKEAGKYIIEDMSYEDIRKVLERGPYEK
ncbi:3-dehydroquinate synthase [Floccifex sp.]|uniref:3-dehydroquinate synthase n=1 Tax=Floccifex sp. TaxID=2815810 RepID=UPI002A754786|nr:3-dehydroquinate synthase [Floccifex sp.]MDD7280461.1 3-dehydroquinate synthase [Erysipelotrichaceae bacterium]MDY2958821.1 3-dehydroquinate synthase [Floccifex sp.]